jgi:SAM-dependent methyltransferase
MLSPTERFSDRVADYVKARPSYPVEVVDLLVRECELDAKSSVADVGCGTGIFTRQLLDIGCMVFGVEPNLSMRDAAIDLLGQHPLFTAIDGTGEATGLNDHSVDLITAAQAFHWFDKEKAHEEFRRVLRPGGYVCLLWNERRSTGTEFSLGYEEILQSYVPEYAKVRHRNNSDEDLLDWYSSSQRELYIFTNDQAIDLDTLLARAFSSSYFPARGTPQHPIVEQELCNLFARTQQGDMVRFEYETKVFLGQVG